MSTKNSPVLGITQSSRYTSIKQIFYDLHWFPVLSSIHFKLNYLITFKAVTFQQPPSLWNLLKVRDVPHDFHSCHGSPPVILVPGLCQLRSKGSLLFVRLLRPNYFNHPCGPPKLESLSLSLVH